MSWMSVCSVSDSGAELSTSTSSNPNLSSSAPPSALYNFRLLSALRSEDASEVQQFLNQLKAAGGAEEQIEKAGQLLGMAVRVASSESLI